jgi:hypothetical protein
MAFASAQNVDASKCMFNDVRQNQYNIQLASSCLEPAFTMATFVASMVQQVQASRQQTASLVYSVDILLKTLDAEYLAGRLSVSQTSGALENLTRYVIILSKQKQNFILIAGNHGE